MDNLSSELTRARALLQDGAFEEAEAVFRALLAAAPGDAEVLNGLGLAWVGLGHYDQGIACFGQVLQGRPDHPETRSNFGFALRLFGEELVRNGQGQQAEVCFQSALQFNPEDAAGHLALGRLRQAQGQRRQAAACFERAVALRPDFIEAMLALGTLHAQVNAVGPACKWYRWALALDPALEEANFNLAALLEGEARLQEAQLYRSRVPRPLPLSVETAPAPRRTVLLPWAAGSGNVPVDTLMPAATTTRIKWFVECSSDAQEAALPPCDLVFNAIGNADIAGFSLERLSRFQQRRPMLNPPERVLRTRRDLMPALLEGIPDLVVPPVARLRRDEVLEPGLAQRLSARGLDFPLLVRPIGTQGGKGASRVDREEQLEAATGADADAFYFIGFHENPGADGHYRKYRMIYVDRRPYPYHLAISRDWLVHYYSAHMLEAPWKREEERAFLERPEAVLGPAASAAVAAVGQRLDLDYAGIDFSLLADGRVLVFEANATMLAHLEDPVADFPYKHVAVPAIYRAFEAMLDARCRP